MDNQKQQSTEAVKMNTCDNERPDQAINPYAKHGRGAKLRGPDLIGAIDQGTSSTRFLVFENQTGHLIASSQIEIKRITPKEGWVEMDPTAIMSSVYATMATVHDQLKARQQQDCNTTELNEDNEQLLKCIGICNQRESAVVWDSQTGQPLYNVIVWMDNRTKDLVDNMIDSVPGRDLNRLKDKTGLPISTYFSAFKLKWLIENVVQVRQALDEKRLLFGTLDTWILWNLTGKHMTDVTNASRTFLMDIETLEWDKSLCKQLKIPMDILPQIRASADDFGQLQFGPFEGTPITGVIGDQSAALFGHNCLQLGQTKATFGTGCFVMQNIGPGPLNGAMSGVSLEAKRGLVTTVAYKLGDRPACYALEGSVKIAGAALTWLRDNLQLIANYEECDHLVNQTTNSAGVYFVPAFGGLYAPYWDPSAAGLFIGLSQFTKREHLARATFDSIAFQTNDILSLMRGVANELMIDGGLCKSENLCQILADITGYDIVRPAMCETSALGAAMIAAHGAGIWSFETMMTSSANTTTSSTTHYPQESLNYEEKFSALMQSKKTRILGKHSKQQQRAAEQLQSAQRQQTAATAATRQRRPRFSRAANLSSHRLHPNLDTGGGVEDDEDAGGGHHHHLKRPPSGTNIQLPISDEIQSTSDDNGSCADELGASSSNCGSSSTSCSRSPLASLDTDLQSIDRLVEGDKQQQLQQQLLPNSLITPANIQHAQHELEMSFDLSEIEAQREIMSSDEETIRRFYAPTSSGYSSGDNLELATTVSSASCLPMDAALLLCERRTDSPILSSLATSTTDNLATAGHHATLVANDASRRTSTIISESNDLAQPQQERRHQEHSINQASDNSNKNDDQLRNVITTNQLACDHALDEITNDEVHAFGERDSYGEDGYDSSVVSNFGTEDGDNEAESDSTVRQLMSMIEQDNENDDETMSVLNIMDINTNREAARLGSRRRTSQLAPKQVDVFEPYITCEHRTDLVATWRLAVERSMQWTKVHHEEIRRIDYLRLSSLPISMYLFFSIGMVALSSILSGQ